MSQLSTNSQLSNNSPLSANPPLSTDMMTNSPAFSATGQSSTLLDKAASFWKGSQRNLILSMVMAVIVAAVVVVALWSSSKTYLPIYGHQERFDVSEIVSVLEAEGISFRLQEQNGQVMVPESKLAGVRMILASRGVKAQLPTGLSVLNENSALGTSQFIESARYRHGLEGELARTIISLDSVVNARVHLAIPRQTLFVRQNAEKPSASVMLEIKSGENLSPEQVEAIINLVVGSVTGMEQGSVSVIDQYGRLLSADMGNETTAKVNAKYLDYQKNVEHQIIQRASDMLTPILGPTNYRVQVAAEMNFNQIEETREVLDEAPKVRQEHTIQDNATDDIALGVPGSMSNKPPVTKKDETAESTNTQSRTEVNRQYAIGSSVRRTQFQQGTIEKLSVSVLLNTAVAPNGTAWSEQEMAQIKTMVMDAVGVQETRGDSMSLMAFNFSPIEIEPLPQMPWWQDVNIQQHLRYLIGGLLCLAMILFVFRPLIKHLTRTQSVVDDMGMEKENAESDLVNLQTKDDIVLHENIDQRLSEKGLHSHHGLEVASDLLPPPGSPLDVQLKHLQLIANEEPSRVAEILKQWIHNNETQPRRTK